MKKSPLIRLENINKSFRKTDQRELVVLKDINFTMNSGEIVALLGKSGSGKSTLLRIISGLIAPSSGQAYYHDQPIHGPVKGISMVFQSFALLPWLTVLGNVELGLEALGVERETRRKRALKAIDTIGLDGFESAYPKELSGGMRQRVGIARALVVEPELLLMDEAFSSLDVLTAENLRTDLLDLWHEKQTRIQGILLVTHNIEEAVMMADRIIIFDADPGRIRAELAIKLPHPRSTQQIQVREMIDEIYSLMTKPEKIPTVVAKEVKAPVPISYRLPEAQVSELTGLIESIALPEQGQITELPELAESLHLGVDELFPLLEMLDILQFAHVSDGTIKPTQAGIKFAEADILEKKQIFAKHLLENVPLAKYIQQELQDAPGHCLNQNKFLTRLEENLSEEEAERVLKTLINWGRYAEIFAFDFDTSELSLENPA